MGNNFIERLQYYMKLKGINDNQMTIAAGLSVGLLGKLKKSGKGMNSSNIEKILYSYPEINASWLLTGKGEMLVSHDTPTDTPSQPVIEVNDKDIKKIPYSQEYKQQITDEKERKTKKSGEKQRKSEKNSECSSRIQKLPEGSMEGIPLIPTSAMAGAFTTDISFMEYECEHYFIPDFKGADFLIRVKGDSMQPTYYSGDLVACQKIPMNDVFFQWNKTYVLDTNQGAIIKRVLPGKDDDHICIVSDNTKYPPFELEKSYLHAIALVRGIIRLE